MGKSRTSARKPSRPLIPAILRGKGARWLYEYRVSHVNWEERANVTGRSGPFSLINLQHKRYPAHHFFPSHSHTMFEFYAVTQGTVTMALGTRAEHPVVLRKGDALLLPPRLFHSAEAERPASVVNVHFAPSLGPVWRRQLVRLGGKKLRLSGFGLGEVAVLAAMPSGVSSGKAARTLQSVFTSLLTTLIPGLHK